MQLTSYKNNYPKKIIKKVEKSSYIITTIQSLSQIFDFSRFFIKAEIPKKDDKIAGDFKDFIENIWKNDDNTLVPRDFMQKLKKISNDFSLKEELEPYKFCDFILDRLNSELNGFDSEINNYFDNFYIKYENIEELKEKFLRKFILKNKSIVSQTFYGIIKTILNCDLCKNDEEIIYEKFNIIDIDIKSFCDYKHLEGYSLTNFYVDDFIGYYFNEKKNNTNEKKNKCKKCFSESKSIERKIIELPNYLIFRINWGEFNEKEGFKCEIEYIKPSYQYLDVNEYIEIGKDFMNEISFNREKQIKAAKFELISTIDYFKKKRIFISKYRLKKEGGKNNWYNFWCGEKGKETKTYIDHFSTPCLLFYGLIK